MNRTSLLAVLVRSISRSCPWRDDATRRGDVSISPQLIEAVVAATARRNLSRAAHVYRPTRAAGQPWPPRVERWNVYSAEAVRYQVTVAPRFRPRGSSSLPPVRFSLTSRRADPDGSLTARSCDCCSRYCSRTRVPCDCGAQPAVFLRLIVRY